MNYKEVILEPVNIDKLFLKSIHKITNCHFVLSNDIKPKKIIQYKGDILENETLMKFKEIINNTNEQVTKVINSKRSFTSMDGEINDNLYPLIKNKCTFTGKRNDKISNNNKNNVGRQRNEVVDIDLYEISFMNIVPELIYIFTNEPYEEETAWRNVSQEIKDYYPLIFENLIYNYRDNYMDSLLQELIKSNRIFNKFYQIIERSSIKRPSRYTIPEMYCGIKYASLFENSRSIRIAYTPEMNVIDKKDLMRLYLKGILLPIYVTTMNTIVKKMNKGVTLRTMANMKFIFDTPKTMDSSKFTPVVNFQRINLFGKEIKLYPKLTKLNED